MIPTEHSAGVATTVNETQKRAIVRKKRGLRRYRFECVISVIVSRPVSSAANHQESRSRNGALDTDLRPPDLRDIPIGDEVRLPRRTLGERE